MLYQTPYPFHFQFHPLLPSSSIPPFPTFSFPLVQAQTRMECMVGALKSSLRKEMAIELSPQTFMEELSVPNGTSCDNFFVDDLLDLSQLDEEPEQQQQQQQQKEENTTRVSVQQENQTNEIQYSFKGDYGASELSVPADDVADLEWLSHFVEDSFSATFPTVAAENHLAKDPEPVFTQACFKTPVQTKARSKRTRTGVRVWSLGSPSFTDSSSASASASSSSSSPSSPFLIYAQTLDQVSSPSKKPKKKHSSENVPAQAPRRCSHCGVQKTPQWRTGPNGPKTLCNACGVRFKSGRLLPEYRPACSPTFSSELHSNHHRKVLEMRRKKEEIVDGADTGFAPPVPVVPSF